MDTILKVITSERYQLTYEDIDGNEHSSNTIPNIPLQPHDVVVGDLRGKQWSGNYA